MKNLGLYTVIIVNHNRSIETLGIILLYIFVLFVIVYIKLQAYIYPDSKNYNLQPSSIY